jgi:hypothetical protein
MDFIILIVWLTSWECQHLSLAGHLMLLDHRVVDTPTIHATPTRGPHLSQCALHVQAVFFNHETLAA